VREYILTEKEREVLKAYLERDEKIYGIYQLLNRAKKSYSRLREDMELLRKALKVK